MKKEKLINKYDKQVTIYENNRRNRTLDSWRNRIISEAKGKVLEVGVGVGANFPYYDGKHVHQVTGVDFSIEMIKSAEKAASNLAFNTKFIHQDIDDLIIEPNSFDTVVSTLTVCSYPNSVETLNKFNNWCRNDGKVLLIEHGLSSNPLLSVTQKMIDPLFTKISGCHGNRNILNLLEKSNLQVQNVETYWSGILSLIWAKTGN